MLSRRRDPQRLLAGLVVTALTAVLVRLVAHRLGIEARVGEASILRYESLSLTLLFADGRLAGFLVETPRRSRSRSGPRAVGHISSDEVAPGQGALGVHFGAARKSVASRFGRPIASHGFADSAYPSGLDFYRAFGGRVAVTIGDGRVSQIAGWQLSFRSRLGFRYGMNPAEVKRVLGAPTGQEEGRFYRATASSPVKMALVAVAQGLLGVVALGACIGWIAYRNWPAIGLLLGGTLVGVSACWARLPPLLADGLYPLRTGPAFGAGSWALAWLGAGSAAMLWRNRIGGADGRRGWVAPSFTLLSTVAVGIIGAIAGDLAVRWLLSIYHHGVRPTQAYWVVSSRAGSIWLAVATLGALAAVGTWGASRYQRKGGGFARVGVK